MFINESGVTGNDKIQSRADFKEILAEYEEMIKGFPGFSGVYTSGSYNSDQSKTTFGDIDLILQVDGSMYENDKKKVKTALAKYLTSQSKDNVVPFLGDKYTGKRYYNSGEIITISYKSNNPNIGAAQVDNIIALDEVEALFKKDFLDMPASKQGIILGATKVALIELDQAKIFKKIGFKPEPLDDNQAYEFNLSSKEMQLRKLTYIEGSFKESKREVVWTSTDFKMLNGILYILDLTLPFEELAAQIKKKFKLKRSKNRLAGVFKSMVSIKSGEVGKKKGDDKQKALDLVNKLMVESSTPSFEDLFEQELLKLTEAVSTLDEGKFEVFHKIGNAFKDLLSGGKKSESDNPWGDKELISIVNKLNRDKGSVKGFGNIDLKHAPQVIKAIKHVKQWLSPKDIKYMKDNVWDKDITDAWNKFEASADSFMLTEVDSNYKNINKDI